MSEFVDLDLHPLPWKVGRKYLVANPELCKVYLSLICRYADDYNPDEDDQEDARDLILYIHKVCVAALREDERPQYMGFPEDYV